MTDLVDTARCLAEARRLGRSLGQYPGPKPIDQAAAYALQSDVGRALGWSTRGYKVGCTSLRAQQLLGTNQPFRAPLYAARVFDTSALVPTQPEQLRVVEPEIAFVMKADLAPRSEPYAVADVLEAVSSVHAAFEVVCPRLPNGLANPVEWLIADGGVNDAFVLGAGVPVLPASAYQAIRVEARVNDRVVGTGIGANALGGAEQVLVWLANHLRACGETLRAGEIVTTGLITDVFRCAPGDEAVASFESLGEVIARF